MEMQVESLESPVLVPAWARLRRGEVAGSAPGLRLAAEKLDAHGDHETAVTAYTLAGEAWACLGHVSAARELLDRADRLAEATGQRHWQHRAGLATALLAARAGREDASTTAAVHEALLSGRPLQRDRAELVQGSRAARPGPVARRPRAPPAAARPNPAPDARWPGGCSATSRTRRSWTRGGHEARAAGLGRSRPPSTCSRTTSRWRS